MSDKKDEIRELFRKHDVPLSQSDVWAVQGTPVIKHSALERLSAKLGLTWDAPREIIASMNEVVILARATRKDGIAEWSYGEVNVVREGVTGGNYRISGKQAGYPWAMAEKRAKDRVIIKLAGLHGAYSEDESDSFDQSKADADEAETARRPRGSRTASPPKEEGPRSAPETEDRDAGTGEDARADGPANDAGSPPPAASTGTPGDELKARIDKAKTINAVTDLMLDTDTQRALNDLPPTVRDEVREHAKARLVTLGWPTKSSKGAAA
ncbi:trna delta -isopentenylpyrophosphate transferase [uncultured Methylobacterium sp.]|uniref:trna delta -isopentenylpyrophosphate transferase n=1 Tax=uncultured Methylobacterium sp. TaxID=157278 RepID=UPI002617845D|nr:trna delta -isopentenylpyrophosphate transferase [uncultured Methylobacterium sp.]